MNQDKLDLLFQKLRDNEPEIAERHIQELHRKIRVERGKKLVHKPGPVSRLWWILAPAVCLGLVGIVFLFRAGITPGTGNQARIMRLAGTVTVRAAIGSENRRARIGELLGTGSIVVTGLDGSCDLHADGHMVRIKPGSVLALDKLKKECSLGLSEGVLLVQARKLLRDENFFVNTPSAVIGVRGTEFLVRAEAGRTVCAVRSGIVSFSAKPSLQDGAERIIQPETQISSDDDGFAEEITPENAELLSELDRLAPVRAVEGKKSFRLSIETEPAAGLVYLDGQYAGLSPFWIVMPADAPVSVRAEKSGYDSASESVSARPDEARVLKLVLKGAATNLSLERLSGTGRIKGRAFAVPGGIVTASDDGIVALTGSSGRIWTYRTGSSVNSSPAIADGRVFVGANDEYLYCLDAATGKLLWKKKTGTVLFGAPTVSGTDLFVGSAGASLACLDVSTGNIRWTFRPAGGIFSAPAVDDSRVYTATADGFLYALDRQNGKTVWKAGLKNKVVGSDPVLADGLIVCGDYDGRIYAFDMEGKKVFEQAFGARISSPVLAKSGRIYSVTTKEIVCLDFSGSVLWRVTPGGELTAGPVEFGASLIVGGKSGGILVVSPEDGRVIKTLKAPGRVNALSRQGEEILVSTEAGAGRIVER